jgi:hypothetical protein
MHRIPPYSLRRQPWKWGRTIATLTGWPECTSAFSRYVETHSILHSRQHDSAVSGVGQFRGLGVKTVQGMQRMKGRATILLLLQVHRPASLPTHSEIIGVASVRYSRSRIGQSLRASRRGALISSTSCRCSALIQISISSHRLGTLATFVLAGLAAKSVDRQYHSRV